MKLHKGGLVREKLIPWSIVILVVFAVPYTHGFMQYVGLVVGAMGLITLYYRWQRMGRFKPRE